MENFKIFFNSFFPSLIGPDKIANFYQNLLELCQFLGTINGTKKFCGWYKYDCIQIQKLNSKCGSHQNPNWPRFNKLLIIITIFRLEILFLLKSWFLKCKYWHWYWWHLDICDSKLVTIRGSWWRNFDIGDRNDQIRDQLTTSLVVTNKFRHQHRCNRAKNSTSGVQALTLGLFPLKISKRVIWNASGIGSIFVATYC